MIELAWSVTSGHNLGTAVVKYMCTIAGVTIQYTIRSGQRANTAIDRVSGIVRAFAFTYSSYTAVCRSCPTCQQR